MARQQLDELVLHLRAIPARCEFERDGNRVRHQSLESIKYLRLITFDIDPDEPNLRQRNFKSSELVLHAHDRHFERTVRVD